MTAFISKIRRPMRDLRLDLKAVQAHGLWKTGEAEIYIFILSTSKGE